MDKKGERRKEGKKKKIKKNGAEREREKKKEKKGFSLLSKIYGDRTVSFHRSKRQSSSMRQELRMDTKIREFRQTPRGREFSYFNYF